MNKGRSELGMKMLDKVCVCVREKRERESEKEKEKERERICLFDGVRERAREFWT